MSMEPCALAKTCLMDRRCVDYHQCTVEQAAEVTIRADERAKTVEELTRTTGVAVRTKLRRTLANHNANFCAESEIDERVQEIIDLIVPAARIQERPRVAEEIARRIEVLEDYEAAEIAREVGRGR